MALLDEFWRSAALLAKAGLGIAFGVWAIRRRYELDLPMTRHGKVIRAAVILACWFIGSVPIARTVPMIVLRATVVVIGLVVLCWPNAFVRAMKGLGHPVEIPEGTQGELA